MDKKKKIFISLFAISAVIVASYSTNFGGKLTSSVLEEKPTSISDMSYAQISQEIAEITGRAKTLTEAIEKINTADLPQVKSDIREAQWKINDIKNTCTPKQREKDFLQKDLDAFRNSWEPLKAKLDAHIANKQKVLGTINDLQQQKNTNNTAVTELQNRQKTLKPNSTEYKELTQQINDKKKTNTTDNAALDKSIAAQKWEIVKIDKDITNVEIQLNDTYKYLEDAYAQLKSSKEAAETKLSNNNTTLSNNNTTLNNLTTQQKGLKTNSAEYKKLWEQITNIKTDNTNLTNTNKALSAEIKKYQTDITAAEKSTSKLSKARATIKALEEKVNNFVMPGVCGELDAINARLTELKSKRAEIEASLAEKQASQLKDAERLPLLQAELQKREAQMVTDAKNQQEKQAQMVAEAVAKEKELNAQGLCWNGSTNPPVCDNRYCPNGAINPPQCTINEEGMCLNGGTNAPECVTGVCTNGAKNFPICNDYTTITTCGNGASNYPECDNNSNNATTENTNIGTTENNNGTENEKCANGAANYPTCWGIGGCANGAIDFPACEDLPIYGCTDPEAYNYNPNANASDNSWSCEFCATEKGDIEEKQNELAYFINQNNIYPGKYNEKVSELVTELARAKQYLEDCIKLAQGD